MIRQFLNFATAGFLAIACTSSKVVDRKIYDQLDNGLYAYLETDKGAMLIRFYDRQAPITVANFIGLAEGKISNEFVAPGRHFYDGLTFHRVIKDFMIQGGDPKGDGSGGPGYEFPNEIDQSLKHDKKGVISMANAGPDTNGSQFFITQKATPWLDGKYSIFAETVHGFEVIDRLASLKTDTADKPLEKAHLQKVSILRKGKEYKDYDPAKIFYEKMDSIKNAQQTLIDRQKEMNARASEIADGLKYVILKKGSGAAIKSGDQIAVHYTLWLEDGKKIDSSLDRNEPFTLTVGSGQVIKGWDKVLEQLNRGDKAYAILPSHWAYGAQGAGGLIPPNATLYFEMEVSE